jgi:CDP-diacylglycerol--serine O-phosphatidyltransferase
VRRVGLIPTLVTLANTYCGVLSIYKTADGKFLAAAYLILLAMIFDVLDGIVARLARAQSTFGAYLDSLSDAVSFGAAPVFLVKTVVEANFPWPALDGGFGYHPKLLTALTIPFALLAVVRLARYNVEHASSEGSDSTGEGIATFAGIPTPGAAGIVASLVMLCYGEHSGDFFKPLIIALPPLCFLLGATMVSRIPYAHFGSRFLKGRRDFSYLFMVLVVIIVAILFPEECAAIGFLAYGISGPILMLFGKKPTDSENVLDDVDIPDAI